MKDDRSRDSSAYIRSSSIGACEGIGKAEKKTHLLFVSALRNFFPGFRKTWHKDALSIKFVVSFCLQDTNCLSTLVYKNI